MRAALLALAGLLIPASLADAAAQSGIPPWRHPEVVQIMCDTVAGSAVRVGPSTFVSVAHVTHNSGCKIGGAPFSELSQHGDFVVLSTEASDPHWTKINCGGFKKDHRYVAIGFALGLDTQTEVDLIGTGEKDGSLSVLAAVFTVVPGMSGGAVLDSDTGEVVGTVNTYNPDEGASGSVALKDTPICKGRIA